MELIAFATNDFAIMQTTSSQTVTFHQLLASERVIQTIGASTILTGFTGKYVELAHSVRSLNHSRSRH
jgi:hypothetical protein